MKQMFSFRAGVPLLLACLLAVSFCRAQSATPVPRLDLNRFTGTWYQIARMPYKPEKGCVSDGLLLYALADKPYRFQLVDSCLNKDGTTNVRNLNGRTADKTGDGRLKLITIWPFSSKYWVFAIDNDYQWALVGTPNHKSLWVLSRTSAMTPDLLAQIEAKASSEGFNTAKLAPVSQRR